MLPFFFFFLKPKSQTLYKELKWLELPIGIFCLQLNKQETFQARKMHLSVGSKINSNSSLHATPAANPVVPKPGGLQWQKGWEGHLQGRDAILACWISSSPVHMALLCLRPAGLTFEHLQLSPTTPSDYQAAPPIHPHTFSEQSPSHQPFIKKHPVPLQYLLINSELLPSSFRATAACLNIPFQPRSPLSPESPTPLPPSLPTEFSSPHNQALLQGPASRNQYLTIPT